ncbi:MAG: ribbon-helix-helix protein, CopG family [Chloroflexi bacterium]|nr:ribbon-helix-helix protein, CopG family [Chloroflexota bacterium]
MTVRLEVRLDKKRRAQLEEIAGMQGASISEVVRVLIDDAYEAMIQEDRRRAVQELTNLRGEAMPDPEELSRQLASAHEPGGI